jgi:hypothetical protein
MVCHIQLCFSGINKSGIECFPISQVAYVLSSEHFGLFSIEKPEPSTSRLINPFSEKKHDWVPNQRSRVMCQLLTYQ